VQDRKYELEGVSMPAVKWDGDLRELQAFLEGTHNVAAAGPAEPSSPDAFGATAHISSPVGQSRGPKGGGNVWPGDWVINTPSGISIINPPVFDERFMIDETVQELDSATSAGN
jgi:hypothetical protein